VVLHSMAVVQNLHLVLSLVMITNEAVKFGMTRDHAHTYTVRLKQYLHVNNHKHDSVKLRTYKCVTLNIAQSH
jgi:hypothetical protein